MSSFARCGICDQEGQWSSPQYRDAWLRWHMDMTGHDDPFCMDFPEEPTQEQKLRRPGNRSDAIAATVRDSIRKQREEQGK